MSQNGLRYERFITRVQQVDDIADEWPFSNMSSNTARESNMGPHVGPYTPAGTYNQGVVVDFASALESDQQRGILRLLQYPRYDCNTRYDMEVSIKPSEVEAWNLLRGIRLATRLMIDDKVHHGSGTRYGIIDRVIGIEQPLRTPGHRTPVTGQRNTGYIHGEITRVNGTPSEIVQGSHFIRLRLGREAMQTNLRRTEDTIVKTDQLSTVINGPVYTGDVIRAHVTRSPDNPYYFTSEYCSPIHILRPSLERPVS